VNDERAAEGLEHLQNAAVELIEAARAFLDVAEDLVRDPAVAATIVQGAATLARLMATGAAPPRAASEDPPGEGRVRHIRVS
jgi:hypothetical protein